MELEINEKEQNILAIDIENVSASKASEHYTMKSDENATSDH